MPCKKCQKSLLASDVFCSGCGQPVFTMRSENEVKAQLQKFKTLPHANNIASIAIRLAMVQALSWVIGQPDEPVNMILKNDRGWDDAINK